VYEIIVYSLFSTLVSALELQVEISISADKQGMLSEFSDFSEMVMGLDPGKLSFMQDARVYRVGVTNAADRGLDMYSNWGPAIQIKHLSLDEEMAETIVGGVTSDRVVIVCKDAEQKVILSLLTQIGWRGRIQSIITEKNLEDWYERALRGAHSDALSEKLLTALRLEISKEFPSLGEMPEALANRGYDAMSDPFWV